MLQKQHRRRHKWIHLMTMIQIYNSYNRQQITKGSQTIRRDTLQSIPDPSLPIGGIIGPKQDNTIRISAINQQLTPKNFSSGIHSTLDMNCDIQGFSETNFHTSFKNRLLMEQQLTSADNNV